MVKILPISETENHIDEILRTFKNGGVVLYPTDTQYGLGARAKDAEAVAKVQRIKKVTKNKPVSIVVSDIEMADRYVHINSKAKIMMEKHLPGALTIILPAKNQILAKNCGNEQEIGIRIPNKPKILKVVAELGEPITTTSANISGQEPKTNCKDILETLDGVDLAIEGGNLGNTASTIIKFSESDFEVIRQGDLKVR